jgi:hypothetical protein
VRAPEQIKLSEKNNILLLSASFPSSSTPTSNPKDNEVELPNGINTLQHIPYFVEIMPQAIAEL